LRNQPPENRRRELPGDQLGNPVEGERDSGGKLNAIPLWFRTAFRSEGERNSGGKANSFVRLPEWCSAWSGMFSTGESQ